MPYALRYDLPPPPQPPRVLALAIFGALYWGQGHV